MKSALHSQHARRNRRSLRRPLALRQHRARRALIEQLEDRRLLAVITAIDFSDPFGNPSAEGFTTSGPSDEWHLSTGRGNDSRHSSDDSFYFGSGEGSGGGGTYGASADGTLTSPAIDLTTAISAKLTFNHFLATEAVNDIASVSVIDSSGNTVIATSGIEFPATTTGFEPVSLDLTPFVGESVQVAFQFTSNATVTAEGWYVDDVVVNAIEPNEWVPQGPFSATNGQVENVSPGDPIVGAIHTVLAHPSNPDILYIGGTNGGVWKTENATLPAPPGCR